jgi:hypothetical protein
MAGGEIRTRHRGITRSRQCLRALFPSKRTVLSLQILGLFVHRASGQCLDVAGWADSGGVGCAEYSSRGWCTAEGQPGPNWDAARGHLNQSTDVATSLSPLQACCSCGATCANVDWADTDGDSCSEWAQKLWCAHNGTAGSGWDPTWGSVNSYTDIDGAPASQACCSCGGGTRSAAAVERSVTATSVAPSTPSPTTSPTTSPTKPCHDIVAWTDAVGDGCDKWVQWDWCDATGAAGPGWNTSWGNMSDFAVAGVAAGEACCGCGGSGGGEPPDTPLVTTCNNHPSWVDDMGSTCDTYERLRWCSTSSTAGPGWEAKRGSIADARGTDGLSAIGACCACNEWRTFTDPDKSKATPSEEDISLTVAILLVVAACVFLLCMLACACVYMKPHSTHILDESELLKAPKTKRASVLMTGSKLTDSQLSWDTWTS